MAHVLIVDDDPSVLRYAAMVLGLEGHRTTEAWSRAQALAALGSASFDCVLLDVRLGADDGPTVLAAARDAGLLGPTPVLMHSSDDPAEYWERARAAGAAGYLEKPVDPDALVAAVDHACHHAV